MPRVKVATMQLDGGGVSPAPPPAPPAPPPPLTTTTTRRKKRQKGELALQTALLQYPTLIDELAELGFNAASDFIVSHEPARVRQAVDRAKSMKGIRNIPGFIRYLVAKPGPIPAPEKPKDGREKYKAHEYLYNRKEVKL
jgi:hypothetical protein